VNQDCLKLTTYFGERDRCDGRFLADALLDVYGADELEASILLRGTEGFGAKHRLHTQRLLTLSEDLPLVAIAVDTRERIEATLPRVTELVPHGLITLEHARLLTGEVGEERLGEQSGEGTKLMIYVGRRHRAGGEPAWSEVVALLHRRGVAGATALLGVDGTAGGARRRARFFGANADVPVMIIAVGDGDRIAAVLPELGALLERPLMTLEQVVVCKRDGRRLAEPQHPPEAGMSQKLMIYGGEQGLVRRLRAAGAAGATVLRGFWGYHGDHPPHGDTFWKLRRAAPEVTVVVDTPQNIGRVFGIVDEMTERAGLVTSEMVPVPSLQPPGLRC
jgi:PII-like signaling protein